MKLTPLKATATSTSWGPGVGVGPSARVIRSGPPGSRTTRRFMGTAFLHSLCCGISFRGEPNDANCRPLEKDRPLKMRRNVSKVVRRVRGLLQHAPLWGTVSGSVRLDEDTAGSLVVERARVCEAE